VKFQNSGNRNSTEMKKKYLTKISGIRMTSDSHTVNLEMNEEKSFKLLRENNLQPIVSYPAKLLIKYGG